MIEVFKTNVETCDQATMLINEIHKNFTGYKANFDLQDCDRILRIKSANPFIESDMLIDLIHQFGFDAEVLPDDTARSDNAVYLSNQAYSLGLIPPLICRNTTTSIIQGFLNFVLISTTTITYVYP